jgi:NAD(P)-dependent dehydrogenase (short-subunit alcohol dehydrogenase family)
VKTSRILVTGSADGLGLLAGRWLVDRGHHVVLHARSDARARHAKAALPGAARVVVGDVSTLAGMKRVAEQANEEPLDAVIHNVALGYREPRAETEDGIERLFAVNSLAPYVLTALVRAPRLVYLSSGLHRGGEADLHDPEWKRRPWNGLQAYSNSKLHDVLLAFAVARRWPDVRSNAIEPGWVPTKMGGAGAPDDLELGALTQAWLAEGADPATHVTGAYLFHQRPRDVHPAARDERLQDAFLAYCAKASGVTLPA